MKSTRTAAPGATKPSPFDWRRGICDNSGVKFHTFVLFLALTACGKANDLPAMKTEAEGIVKNFQTRFEDLNRRADSIMQRGNAIGVTSPDAASASRMFAMAKSKLEQLRGDVNNASGEIAKVKDKIEMQKYIDRTKNQLEDGYIEINTDFDAVESWITLAEAGPQVAHREPVVPPPAAPDSPPQTPPNPKE
jgi:hypothetical protein